MLDINIPKFAYGRKEVLKDINIQLKEGEIVGLVAPNGTGKSTLIQLLAGVLVEKSSSITLNEKNYQQHSVYMKQQIVRMPDQADLYEHLTGLDHLLFYARMWKVRKELVQEVIDCLQMSAYIKKSVRSYSLGMKQRLCFALVLVTDAKYLLLDEVMNGLDPDNVHLISNVLLQLKSQQKHILLASHLLDNLDTFADTVYFINNQTIQMTYHPQEKELECVELVFRTVEQLQVFEEFLLSPVVINQLQCTIELNKVPNKDALFTWIRDHINQFVSVTVGPKGCRRIYQKLYLK